MVLLLVTVEIIMCSEPHTNLSALTINPLIRRDPQGLWNIVSERMTFPLSWSKSSITDVIKRISSFSITGFIYPTENHDAS